MKGTRGRRSLPWLLSHEQRELNRESEPEPEEVTMVPVPFTRSRMSALQLSLDARNGPFDPVDLEAEFVSLIHGLADRWEADVLAPRFGKTPSSPGGRAA